uniref:Sequestosome 1 n=1 Tax=Salmo trutta TaxID=8032 RepID=A0A674CZW8_SALTR
MSMTVKAYLLGKEDAPKEIRRIAVDQDVSTSFEYLKKKVEDVFSTLRNVTYQMFYKDEDGDMIAFSTDDETATSGPPWTPSTTPNPPRSNGASIQYPEGHLHPPMIATSPILPSLPSLSFTPLALAVTHTISLLDFNIVLAILNVMVVLTLKYSIKGLLVNIYPTGN